MEKKVVTESLEFNLNTAVPCAATRSLDVRMALTVTLPNGARVPVAFAEIVPTGLTTPAKLPFVRETSFFFSSTVMLPEPVILYAWPNFPMAAPLTAVKVTEPVAPLYAPTPPLMGPETVTEGPSGKETETLKLSDRLKEKVSVTWAGPVGLPLASAGNVPAKVSAAAPNGFKVPCPVPESERATLMTEVPLTFRLVLVVFCPNAGWQAKSKATARRGCGEREKTNRCFISTGISIL